MNLAVPGFDIVEPIGSGGFSRVYRARQRDLDRDVALKVLTVDLETESQRRAFERECKAMGALAHHPSIVSVFTSAFAEDGRPCIVMEHFGAGTFTDRLDTSGPLDVASLLAVGIELAGALQTAHDHGVVHRDIKPSNVFVSAFGTAVLGDFGIASVDDERTITGGGGLTVHYAPPELIEGEPATVASDIYSLAASLFTLASGDKPYPKGPGQTTADLARRILIEPTPRLGGDVPASFAALVERSMSKRPEDRPASATEFGHAVQAVQLELGLNPTPLIAVGHASLRSAQMSGRREAMRSSSHGAPPTTTNSSSTSRTWSTSGSRRVTAAALATFALIALASTAVALGNRGGDAAGAGEAGSTPSTVVELPDGFFSAPAVPEGVAIDVDDEGRTFASWLPVAEPPAVGYQVELVGTGVVLETDETQLMLETDDSSVCVVVRAVGAGGRLSADSDPVCRSS